MANLFEFKPKVQPLKTYVDETLELLESRKADVCKLIDSDYSRFYHSTDWSRTLTAGEHQDMGEEEFSEPLICLLINKFKENPKCGKDIVDTLKVAAEKSRNALLQYLLDHEKTDSGKVLQHKLNMFFTFVHLNWKVFTKTVVIDLPFLTILQDQKCLTEGMKAEVNKCKVKWQKHAFVLVRLLRTQEDWYPSLLYALCKARQQEYLTKCHDDLLKDCNWSSPTEPLPFTTIKSSVDKWFHVNYSKFGPSVNKPTEKVSTDGAALDQSTSTVVTSDEMEVETRDNELSMQFTAQEQQPEQTDPRPLSALQNTRSRSRSSSRDVTQMEMQSEQLMKDCGDNKEMECDISDEDKDSSDSNAMDSFLYSDEEDENIPTEIAQPIVPPAVNPSEAISPAAVSLLDEKKVSTCNSPSKNICSTSSSPSSSSSHNEANDCAPEEIEMADALGIGTETTETLRSVAPVSQRKSLELRPYQRDLAKDACDNHNVIIVAPTNSGKTHVAMYIAQNHLHRDPNHRILFIVHRVNLVDQQYKQFVDYFPQNEVEKMSGGGNLLPLSRVVKDKKIVVLTVDILRNALEFSDSDDRFFLSYVSLLIFDECHNCMKDHPYNVVMDFYFEECENVKTAVRKPQIVGLTASPGTGKADNQDKAFLHLLTLCGNLDSKRIAYKSDEEVQTYMQQNNISEAKLDIVVIHADVRRTKWLDQQLQSVMKRMEDALQLLKQKNLISSDCGRLLNIPTDKRGGSEYTNFVGNLTKIVEFIRSDDPVTRKVVECLRSLLDILNRSLQVYLLFRDEDCIHYLRENLPAEDVNPVHEVERRLLASIRNEVIAKSIEHVEENPCLQQLKQQVLNQVTKEPDSRILVFVKERLYTTLLVNAFRDDPDPNISHIPVDAIVGAQNDTDTVHSTQNWQREVLIKFREGHNKVLFSTSVTEEGLDIVKCNLVVRYVHVTNEIAMVQSRGRARAGHSKYVLIYHEQEAWIGNKEGINKSRHTMMISAVERFHKFHRSGSETDKMIDNIIRERKVVRGRKKETNANANASKTTIDYQFQCKKCQQVASYSRYIRKRGSHYFCLDPTVKERCEMKRKASEKHGDLEIIGKLMCGNCKSHPWGVQCLYSEKPCVVLSIKNFNLFPVLENRRLGPCELCAKWTAAPFQVKDLDLASFLDA